MNQIKLRPGSIGPLYCREDVPLVQLEVSLPCCTGPGGRRISRYYDACERGFARYCRRDLFPRADGALLRAQETGGAIPAWHLRLQTAVTWQSAALCSLYLQAEEHTDRGCSVLRWGDTWDLRQSLLLAAGDFFPRRSPWRKRLLEHAAREIRCREAEGTARFFPDWPRRLRAALHSRHFYLTEEGLCFFCQPGTLEPGVSVFCLPYDSRSGPFPPQP